MGKYTIRDIARMAGVSRSTVSLVLNNSPSVSESTRSRVLDVIGTVGYRPSAQARGLVSRRSNAVALIVPAGDEVFRNFYLAETVAGILQVLEPQGYKLVIEPATTEFLRERAYETIFEEGRVDGALMVVGRANDPLVARMRDAGYPLCQINGDVGGVPRVVADNRAGAAMAARHLAALGHHDIALIRGPDHLVVARERNRGFMEAMEELGLALPPERCAFGNFTEYGGYEAMGKLLRQWSGHPAAVFVSNDMMALGAIQRLKNLGLQIPEDVAVVGADDILLATYSFPALTTIRQSLATLGRRAAEVILDQIARRPAPSEVETIPAPLIIRESCGARLRPG